MRKLLAAVLIAAPAIAIFSTGAAAIQCVQRPGQPSVLDCFENGTYQYSTDAGSYAAPPVYAYAPTPPGAGPVYRFAYRPQPQYYRTPFDEPSCGPYRDWSDSAGRCIPRYRYRTPDRDYADEPNCGRYRYWSRGAGRCITRARYRDSASEEPYCGRSRYWSRAAGRCITRARYRARDYASDVPNCGRNRRWSESAGRCVARRVY